MSWSMAALVLRIRTSGVPRGLGLGISEVGGGGGVGGGAALASAGAVAAGRDRLGGVANSPSVWSFCWRGADLRVTCVRYP